LQKLNEGKFTSTILIYLLILAPPLGSAVPKFNPYHNLVTGGAGSTKYLILGI
jgi:hypothetical protein